MVFESRSFKFSDASTDYSLSNFNRLFKVSANDMIVTESKYPLMKGAHMAYQEDMDCIDFSNLLSTKEPYYFYSKKYDSEVHKSEKTDGKTQQELMVPWFAKHTTDSAKSCYYNLQNAASLLWIAEAVDIDRSTVAKAFKDAKQAENFRQACKAIRNSIKWSDIIESLNTKTV